MFDALCYIVKVHCKRWLYLTLPEREPKLSENPCLHNSAVKGKNVHVYVVHILVKDTFSCPTALALISQHFTHVFIQEHFGRFLVKV